MQRNTFVRTLLAAAACAATTFAAQAQTTKLTLGHGAAPGNPRHEAALKFGEVVKARTNGRIDVQVAPSAQLGDDAAMVTTPRTGALDLSANSRGAVANAVPEYAAFGMPFLYSNAAQAFKPTDFMRVSSVRVRRGGGLAVSRSARCATGWSSRACRRACRRR